jgi:hypothetical protein
LESHRFDSNSHYLGISRNQTSKFQQLAEIPEKDFEDAIADPTEVPGTQGVIDRVKKTRTSDAAGQLIQGRFGRGEKSKI